MNRFIPLFLVAAGLAAPAMAQSTPGMIWTNYSYGQVTQQYDQDGEAQDTGSKATIQRAAIGTSYNVMQMGDASLWIGAEVAFAALKNDLEASQNDKIEVGFKPQNLSVMTGYRTPAYGFKFGYMADIGNELNVKSSSEVELPNSDGTDAVLLGGNFTYPIGALAVTAGADYYLTLEQNREGQLTTTQPGLAGTYTLSFDSDPADYLDAYLTGAYKVTPSVELGLTTRWHQRFAGEIGTVTATGGSSAQNGGLSNAINAGVVAVPTVAAETDGYALLVVPHLKYTASAIPLSLRISGGTIREYAPYGFSLVGERSPVGRRGVTVGLTFGF